MEPKGLHQVSGFIGIFLIQITIIILYGIFVRYGDEMLPSDAKKENLTSAQRFVIDQKQGAKYPRKYWMNVEIVYLFKF